MQSRRRPRGLHTCSSDVPAKYKHISHPRDTKRSPDAGLMLVHFLWRWPNINPLTAKLFNLNFHPLEVVSRWHDPQLQVSEN